MSFDEESKARPKPSQSFRKNRTDFSILMSGFQGRIGKEEIYQKVDEILFFIYETLSEQLFQMPLPISNTPEKRRSFREKHPSSVDFDQD